MSQPEILRWDQAYNRNGDGKLPRAVVNVIRTYMNNHTLTGWVSQETLARDTGLDESNVRRQIRKNVDAGWLVVTKRGRAGRASEYRLNYPQPGEYARLESAVPNRANTPGYTPLPSEYARLQPGEYARPTSPRTSPQEKFSIAVGGRTEASEGGADDRNQEGPSRMLEPATAEGPHPWSDDPFANEGEHIDARERRAYSASAEQMPQSDWPPKRPPSDASRPRSFSERVEAMNL